MQPTPAMKSRASDPAFVRECAKAICADPCEHDLRAALYVLTGATRFEEQDAVTEGQGLVIAVLRRAAELLDAEQVKACRHPSWAPPEFGQPIKCSECGVPAAELLEAEDRFIAGKANCGCYYHAEKGIPCEHDRALAAVAPDAMSLPMGHRDRAALIATSHAVRESYCAATAKAPGGSAAVAGGEVVTTEHKADPNCCGRCGNVDCDVPEALEAMRAGCGAKNRLNAARYKCRYSPPINWRAECARRDETIAELVKALPRMLRVCVPCMGGKLLNKGADCEYCGPVRAILSRVSP